ncbi:hypothetical protein [Streptomyces sp. NPDC089919]|uniref:hypothetical protein n=1 Tax=Streptomyces sp. NPDC089919 TaxID=3155188 RepID=UPI003420A637
MTPHEELRLLPWSGPDEKPCFLSTDSEHSHLSRLADEIEEAYLAAAADLAGHALKIIATADVDSAELRDLAAGLSQSLSRTLRVAQSRGRRLASPDRLASDENG